MVNGLERLAEHFKHYTDRFVIIGGTACQLIFESEGLDFRATHDIDIVVLIESMDAGFINEFWAFVDSGQYISHCRQEADNYYRFQDPRQPGYPEMIELLCRKAFDLDPERKQHITPIPVGDGLRSLSAIILDDRYYSLLSAHIEIRYGLPVLKKEILVLLKIRAFFDNQELRKQGVSIHKNDMNKHRKDALVLVRTLDPNLRIPNIEESIKADVIKFIQYLNLDPNVRKDLNMTRSQVMGIVGILQAVYL